jgi:hypothetical protein
MKVQQIDFTPLEVAETLEDIAAVSDLKAVDGARSGLVNLSKNDASSLRVIASMLRKISAGEYTPVVHAQWEEVNPGHDILFECSNCGRIISTSWGSCEDEDTKGNNGCDPTEEWLCCPTCGAPMDEKGDSHDLSEMRQQTDEGN